MMKSQNLRNSYWNVLDTILYPISFLAATPYFIDSLGEPAFGAWMLINSIMVTTQALNFGLGTSLIHKVAKYLGDGATDSLLRLIYSGLWLSVIMSVVMSAIGLLFGALLNAGSWLHLAKAEEADISYTISIAGLVLGCRLIDQAFQSIYKGFERYERAAWFSLSYKLLSLLVNLILVYMGYGIVGIFVSRLLIALATLGLQVIFLSIFLRSMLPDSRVRTGGATEVRELLGYGFWTWLQTLASIALFQLDKLLVAGLFGAGVLAYYSLASMIQSHMHISLGSVAHWLFPKVSREKAANRPLMPLFLGMRAFVVSFGILSILALFFLRWPIFELWMGVEKCTKMMPFFECFLLLELLVVLLIVPNFFFNGLGEAKRVAIFESAHKTFGILGMLLGYLVWPTAEGLILGVTVGIFVSLPGLFHWLSKPFFNRPFFKEGILVFIPSCFAAALVLSGHWWMQLGLLCLVLASLYLIFWKFEDFKWKSLIA